MMIADRVSCGLGVVAVWLAGGRDRQAEGEEKERKEQEEEAIQYLPRI